MHISTTRCVFFFVTGFFLSVMIASAQQGKKPFTVADEVGLAHFGDPYGVQAEAVQFSPDGNYFAVDTERGRLDLNCVEDSLRFYRSQDVASFLKYFDVSEPPSPVWVVNRSHKEGPIIKDWRWLADSSGVAYIEKNSESKQQLVLADLRKKSLELLTSQIEMVKSFDIRDRQHYVYTAADSTEGEGRKAELQTPAVVGTGRSLIELLFPDDPRFFSSPSRLWAVFGGRRFEVKHDGAYIVPDGSLALSPDGSFLVTILTVPEVPPSWETLYPPPYASSPGRIHAGPNSAQQYVRIDLQAGSVQALTEAPISRNAGWWVGDDSPSWSSDGQAVLLPGTFLLSKDHVPSRPCVAVVDFHSNTRTCVEVLKGHTETGVEEGYHRIDSARFVKGDRRSVMVIATNHEDQSVGTTEYRRAEDGTWQVAEQIKGEPKAERNGLEVIVKQGLNEPPQLLATNKQASWTIWDPNPQLRNFELGEATVYRWKDKKGREWKGGLYKPVGYKSGQRYPLVIQTHGFEETEFRPSGVFPTAMAARALAATGIMVLQAATGVAGANCPMVTPEEGPCYVAVFESATTQLVSEGLVDPDKIGIVGFSRTCFYVMEMLTNSLFRLKAASITDGVMLDYLQYMIFADDEGDSMIGAKPFGAGLQQWLKRSPGFNLDKIATPLLVVGAGPLGVSYMLQPYAGLRYLKRPVDLIMLNTDEHVLTNPAVRMASQGGSVDWFRFWLQDYEDPNPAKREQYVRWRELRKLQEQSAQQLQQANPPSVH